jgi:hypothetical protein
VENLVFKMTYLVETHSDAAAALLLNMAELNLVSLHPSDDLAAIGISDDAAYLGQLLAWANEPQLDEAQRAARHVLVPRLLELQKRLHAKPQKNWSGVIGRETGEKMLHHVEKLRNEWDRTS